MPPDSPNVVLVVLDTTRGLDTVPAHESGLPTLAALAEDGSEYRRAFTTAPWTLPSHAGLFTGTYPSRHGVSGSSPVLDESLATLPELFGRNGYKTRAISNNTWVSDEFGFDRGFDTFHHAWTPSGDSSGAATSDDEGRTRATERCTAERSTDPALDCLSSMGREPSFLFVNYIDAHFRYAPPGAYVADRLPDGYDYERAVDLLTDPREYDAGSASLTETERGVLRALYRGELAYLDDNLRRLVGGLKREGHWEDTVLVVTSDHGENVGDHGFVGHQYNLYDTLLHVPLVVTGGAFGDGGGTDRLVQLTDLAPTLLDEAGIDDSAARAQFQGRSFHPSTSTPAREYVVAEHVEPRPAIETLERRFGSLPRHVARLEEALPLRAIRTDTHKLVLGADGSRELYDVDTDPMETEDVSEQEEAVGDRLRDELEAWLDSFDQQHTEETTDIRPETEARLRDLGYL